MKHRIKVRVGKGVNMRERGTILGCGKRTILNRALSAVLTKMYGYPIPTLLLVPGDSVESISINEVDDGETDADNEETGERRLLNALSHAD